MSLEEDHIKEGIGAAKSKGVSNAKIAKEVLKSGTAAGAAVSAATGLTVAATSGAGITSGLAAAGGIVGGGMAMGPAVLAAGPAYAGAKIINDTLFKDQPELSSEERDARSAARTATGIGAAAGVAGAGVITVAGGASGAAIMGTLASIGSVVGGGDCPSSSCTCCGGWSHWLGSI
ncbi:MAG: hypothetical protein WCO45_02195 [Pseudanabaena sp. ELA607]